MLRSRTRFIAIGVIGAAVALSLGAFVWPTVYRYAYMNRAGTVLPVRIHRITGTTEILYSSGWQTAEEAPSSETELSDVPVDQLEKLQPADPAKPESVLYMNQLICKVYNGSSWRIREITVQLTVVGDNRTLLMRVYRLANDYFTEPLETGIFEEYIGFEVEDGQPVDWRITGAKGVPADDDW